MGLDEQQQQQQQEFPGTAAVADSAAGEANTAADSVDPRCNHLIVQQSHYTHQTNSMLQPDCALIATVLCSSVECDLSCEPLETFLSFSSDKSKVNEGGSDGPLESAWSFPLDYPSKDEITEQAPSPADAFARALTDHLDGGEVIASTPTARNRRRQAAVSWGRFRESAGKQASC